MEVGSLRKVAAKSAAEVCGKFELSDPARTLLSAAGAPAPYLAAVIDAALWTDAIRFLAFALPKREAVWWACVAARTAFGPTPLDGEEACVAAAEEWVYRPSDEARRAVFPLAEKVGFKSPSGYAGLAAFWSDGSLAPPDQPPVPPDEKLCPTAVAAAVLLAAVVREPHKAQAKYRTLLASGLDIANGGNGRIK
jgi:hypothetical protein